MIKHRYYRRLQEGCSNPRWRSLQYDFNQAAWMAEPNIGGNPLPCIVCYDEGSDDGSYYATFGDRIAVMYGLESIDEGKGACEDLWKAICSLSSHIDVDDEVIKTIAKKQGWDVY